MDYKHDMYKAYTYVLDESGAGTHTSIHALFDDLNHGDRVLIRNGTYDTTADIGITKRCYFEGESQKDTVIDVSNGKLSIGAPNISFKYIRFDIGTTNDDIFYISDSDFTVDHCSFVADSSTTNIGRKGFDSGGTGGRIRIRNCYFSNLGIGIDITSIDRVWIEDCYMEDVFYGIVTTGNTIEAMVTGNYIKTIGTNNRAISLNGLSGLWTIKDNVCRGGEAVITSNQGGIYLGDYAHYGVVIEGNIVYNWFRGIVVADHTATKRRLIINDNHIYTNDIADNSAAIFLENCEDSVVSSNSIYMYENINVELWGIYVDECKDVTVSSNFVYVGCGASGNPITGIRWNYTGTGYAYGVTIIGNVIDIENSHGAPTGHYGIYIYLTQDGLATCTGNTVFGAGHSNAYGIYYYTNVSINISSAGNAIVDTDFGIFTNEDGAGGVNHSCMTNSFFSMGTSQISDSGSVAYKNTPASSYNGM